MKPRSTSSSIRSLRVNAAAIIAHAPSDSHPYPVAIPHPDAVRLPAFDNPLGTETCKEKCHFIRATLEKQLADAVGDKTARLLFTEHWKYNNCSQAIVIGWPDGIEWGCISMLAGHETAYNILLARLRLGYLYIRVASTVEWADHQADGACRGVVICDTPSDTAPRCDRCIRRSKFHVRKRLRPVPDVPKSAEFVEDSDADAELGM